MPVPQLSSEFLDYLAHAPETPGDSEANGVNRIPSLAELSKQMGISVARLREQLEVAEALGLVEVRPRTGIRRLPYSFLPAVLQSLSYAVALDRRYFDLFAALRNQVEAAFWRAAVQQLAPADIQT
ncbi:MAG TPA: hypothetical protein VLS48_08005, partial [Anaerolineales bacterium]|nr:hypothetical protein [Anaerolineales bacterium]